MIDQKKLFKTLVKSGATIVAGIFVLFCGSTLIFIMGLWVLRFAAEQ